MWTYVTYDELYHHGIKGQTWGVRRGPPYPLEDGRSNRPSKSEETPKKKGLSEKAKIALGIAASVAVVGALGYVGVKSGALDGAINLGAKAVANILPSTASSIPIKTEFNTEIAEKVK